MIARINGQAFIKLRTWPQVKRFARLMDQREAAWLN